MALSLIWKTIDLSELRSPNPFYSAEEDVRKLTKILKISLSLSNGSPDKLIFPFTVTLQDGLFIHAAERTTNLKRLVLPYGKRIELSEAVMCRAFRGCQELESLPMPCTLQKRNILNEISTHCNIRELKIVTVVFFDRDKAELLAEFLPKLRVLSIRCTMLDEDVLIFIIISFKDLEVLNISHSLIIVPCGPPPFHMSAPKEISLLILEKASRLQEFITCVKDSCIMCNKT